MIKMFTKTSIWSLIAIFCVCELKFCSGDDEPPLVRVKQGLIRGITEKSLNGREFYSYMSIPYAEPPVGKLRFKSPFPLESWDGVLDGTKMPVSCHQTFIFNNHNTNGKPLTLTGQEDCLQLNVFTHVPNKRNETLPVMVYIHGGGFFCESANEYQPHVLMNEDIVLVVIQYRLGVFGFLSTEDPVMPGNMGLKDQQLALKWVKENIEAFGGDSKRITIFGESAGGASVHYHILSPGSKGLFNRAIIQSGTALCPWASNKNHRKFAIETGQEFNCSLDFGTEKYLECMQGVNPYYLTISALKSNFLGLGTIYVLPRVDGEFIEEPPEVLMKKGKYNKVEVIAGVTRDEGGIEFLFEYMFPNRRENINKKFDEFGAISLAFHDEENSLQLATQVYQYYLQRDDVTTTDKDWKAIVDITSDRMFRVCHDTVAKFFAADPDVKFYMYIFDYFGHVALSSVFPGFNRRNVISHGDDLVYLFYGGPFLPTKLEHKDDLQVRNLFLDLWSNFAKTGNPTPSGYNFGWDEARSNSFRYLSLNLSPVMKEDDFHERRQYWSSLQIYQNWLLQSTSKEEL